VYGRGWPLAGRCGPGGLSLVAVEAVAELGRL